ncbi:MAG: hypothetical protein ACI86M_002849 [Saprospiraceae bacterium]|jgi:hypothetical protein
MNSPTDPQAFHLRPRFTFISHRSIEELCESFRESLRKPDSRCSGKVRSRFVSLYPNSEDRHYWSSHFSLSMDESEDEEG